MRLALRLARRGFGRTSPNPMVGAVLARDGEVIGQGWHRVAGGPHAEVEAMQEARRGGKDLAGSTLVVTLEPCSTHGRTPPCTEAIVAAGVRRVIVAATDPNPAHAGRGLEILRATGVEVEAGCLAEEATRLNVAFNHWIVHRTPYVTVKAAMTLDGRIATALGESKWITSAGARTAAMRFRVEADAILVGVRTVLADDPALTARSAGGRVVKPLRRFVLDSRARTPLGARLWKGEDGGSTTVVVTREASARRVAALRKQGDVWVAPNRGGRVDIGWVLKRMGGESISHLLVEGGGEVNASFLLSGRAQRVVFFYAPRVLGGGGLPGVGGEGVSKLAAIPALTNLRWRRVGPDLMLVAEVAARGGRDR